MLGRLWWKEWRVFRPLATALVAVALFVQWVAVASGHPTWRGEALALLALGWTALYAFAVSAAAFAGEREEATLRWLDAVPVGRRTLWAGKASFAVVSTALLAFALALVAAWGTAPGAIMPYRYLALFGGIAALLLEAVAWGLFWSSFLRSVLPAAVLAVVCSGTVSAVLAVQSIIFSIDGLGRTAPVRVAVACAILPASWWFLVRTPRPASARPRWISISLRPLVAALRPRWRHSAGRSVAWQTQREALGTWLGLMVLCIIVPILWGFWVERPWRAEYALFAIPACLVAGISVWHAENRTQSYRVYVHHGVAPARVWWIKARTWVLLLAVPWGLACAAGVPGYDLLVFMPAALTAFAVGVLCGQAIERGVTATALGACATTLLLAPAVALVALAMVPGWGLLLPPAILLAVSWAWSADWMLRRPGRWVRLGAALSGLFAGLFAAQTAHRAWGIPDIGRIAAPAATRGAAASEAASPLYEQAYLWSVQGDAVGSVDRGGMAAAAGTPTPDAVSAERVDYTRVILGEHDPHDPRVLARWKANEKAIALARQAAERPAGGFPLAQTVVAQSGGASRAVRVLPPLAGLLAFDAREQAAHADLKMAWEDVRAVFRMARQVSDGGDELRLFTAAALDRQASHMAMRWALEPQQTREALHAALAEVRGMPERLPLADTLRTDAGIWERSLRLPLDQLVPWLAEQAPPPAFLGRTGLALVARVFVNPWERERAVPTGRLWFADLLEDADREPWQARRASRRAALRPLRVRLGGRDRELSTAELAHYVATTPLVRLFLASEATLTNAVDTALVDRRALVLVLALRSWALAHGGELPERLDALVPSELDRLPLDPYTGQPFGYESGDLKMARPIGWYAPGADTPYRSVFGPAVRGARNLVSAGPGDETVFAIPSGPTAPAQP